MVLGDSMSVLLELDVDISDIAKLKKAQQAVERFENDVEQVRGASRQAARSLDEMASKGAVELKRLQISTGRASEEVSQLGDAARVAAARFSAASKAIRAGLAKITAGARKAAASISAMTGSLQQAKMAMLGLMFTSLNMVFIFGGILALSPRIRAGLVAVAGALRLVALEAGKMVAPHLFNLAEAIRNLDEEQRKLIAKIAVFGTALSIVGVLAGAFGQALLTLIGIFTGLGSVAFAAASRLAMAFGLVFSSITRLAVTAGSAITTMVGLVVSGAATIKGALMAVAGGSALAAGKIVLVIGLIVGAVALAVMAFRRGGGNIKKTMKKVGENIRTIANSMIKVFKNMTAEVLKTIGDLMVNFGTFVKEFAGIISAVVRPMLKTMGAQFIITFNLIANLIQGAAKGIRNGMDVIATVGKDTANFFIEAWNTVADSVTDSINFLIKKFNKLAKELPHIDPISLVETEELTADKFQKDVKNTLEDANKKLDEGLVDLAGAVAGEEAEKQVKNLNDAINKTFNEENFEKFGKGMKDAGKDLKEFGKDLKEKEITVGKIAKTLKKLPSQAASKLKNLIGDGAGNKLKKFQSMLTGGSGAAMSNIQSIVGGKNVSGAGNLSGTSIGKEIKETKKEINNEINIDADVSEEIDVRDMADEINEVIERSNKRSSSTI